MNLRLAVSTILEAAYDLRTRRNVEVELPDGTTVTGRLTYDTALATANYLAHRLIEADARNREEKLQTKNRFIRRGLVEEFNIKLTN